MLGRMRSRTPPDLPGRCRRCFLLQRLCLCDQVPRIETKTQIFMIRHWKEQLKSTNTARLAALALPSLTLRDYGAPEAPFDEASVPADAWLLFPDGGSREPPAVLPKNLVVVDGTWKQARRIVHHVPALRAMPRLVLPPPRAGTHRLRQPPVAEGRSTLEAIAAALGKLEGEAVGEQLEKLHRLFVDRILSCRGETVETRKLRSTGS
jgi:DTW domain-containing protein